MSVAARRTLACLLLLLLGGLAWRVLADPSPTMGEVPGGRGAPPATGSPAPALHGTLPGPVPRDEAGDALVAVEVGVVGDDDLRCGVDLYAGASFEQMTALGSVRCGDIVTVRVPRSALTWYGRLHDDVAMETWRYQHPTATVARIEPGLRILLEVPRGSGQVTLRARTPAGEGVALVEVELAHAADPSATRRLTDEHGEATWRGVRTDLLGADAVRIAAPPSGLTVLQAPLRATADASDAPYVQTYEAVLVRAGGRLGLEVDDVATSTVVVAYRMDGTQDWQPVSSPARFDVVPRALAWSAVAPPLDTRTWSIEAAPVPGYIRGVRLPAAEYRVTHYMAGVGIRQGLVTVGASEEVRSASWEDVPAQVTVGRLSGPAVGRARWALAHLGRTASGAPSEQIAAVRLPFDPQGRFVLHVPLDVRSVYLTVRPLDEDRSRYVVIPEVFAPAALTVVASTRPVTVGGTVVGPQAGSLSDYDVHAQVEPIDEWGRFPPVARLVPVPRVHPTDAGAWTLPPGPPGVWRITVAAPGGKQATTRILATEGRHVDVGPLSLPEGE